MAGYEGSIKAATASAVFKVRCKSTRPGEAVFVIGSHEALGAWSTAMALPLTTSADTFPTWQSAPVPLMAGMMIEYKFIIQREDRQGTPQWQKFDGNYRVTPVAGQVLQAVSDWEVASAEISTLEVPEDLTEKVTEKPTESDKAAAKHEKEEILLKMAESQVEKAAAEVTSTCPLAVTLTKREMSRRNFSQSLLTLDVDAPGEAQKEDKDAKEEKEDKEEKDEKDEKDEKEKSEKVEKPKEPESTPQSTTATEEPKEPETAVDAVDNDADVVVTQAPLVDEDEAEEYEVPLKQPDVRGVSLKHITCLGTSPWYRKDWKFQSVCLVAQDFVFVFWFQVSTSGDSFASGASPRSQTWPMPKRKRNIERRRRKRSRTMIRTISMCLWSLSPVKWLLTPRPNLVVLGL